MTAEAPLVSVVIPTYNRRHLVGQAIESALAQSWRSLEVVVTDDGSTDGSWPWLESAVSDWGGRVRILRTANAGPSDARQQGLQAARGDFVQFLDSDDQLLPHKIERQLDAWTADGRQSHVIVCVGRVGSIEGGWGDAIPIGVLCGDGDCYVDRMCGRTVHVLHTSAPLWRTDLLRKAGGWPKGLYHSEEWEFHIRVLLRRPRIVQVDEPLFWVRAHAGPQLSKDGVNSRQSMSIVTAHRLVADALRHQGALTAARQLGLLSRLRGPYLQLLRGGISMQLESVEKLIDELSRQPKLHPHYWLLPRVRRVLGTAALPLFFDSAQRLAGRVRRHKQTSGR